MLYELKLRIRLIPLILIASIHTYTQGFPELTPHQKLVMFPMLESKSIQIIKLQDMVV